MRVFEFGGAEETSRTLELRRDPVESDGQLESWLHANPDAILDEPLLIFGRQCGLDTWTPDLLALDKWGNVVVVELEKGTSGSKSANEETMLSRPQDYVQSVSRYEYEELNEVYSAYKDALDGDRWAVGDPVAGAASLVEAHESVFGGRIDPTGFNTCQRTVLVAEEVTSRTERTARYLLERGLAVQCVEVQRFGFPEDTSTDRNSAVLVTSTVVDYPLSRVRHDASTADFSDLTGAVRDRVAPRVRGLEGVETVKATPTRVRIESAYPPGLRYELYVPGNEAGRLAAIRINVGDVSEEHVEAVRSTLTDHAEARAVYRVADDGVVSLVTRDPIRVDRSDGSGIGELTEEVVSLVDWAQPWLSERFAPGD
jgi:hypothetical protein